MERRILGLEDSPEEKWCAVLKKLRKEFGEAVYKSWFSFLRLQEDSSGVLGVAVPTAFIHDWITTHYLSQIHKFFEAEYPGFQKMVLRVDSSCSLEEEVEDVSVDDAETTSLLGSPLDERLTFDSFVVGKPNELAHAAARRVAESDKVTFNPLFLYGGVGLGKTHLMNAIGHHIRTCQRHRKVMYLSAEKFMYQFIRALRYKDTVSFKERFRSVDILMIDDVQFIGGKESTQEEFFHTFNALVDKNHQVVVSADKSPSDLEGMEERLRSRLGWGLVADIHPTTYELRLGILQAKGEHMSVPIPRRVLEFLACKITSNVRELEGALIRIVAHSTLIGREISIEMVQEVLCDLLRSNERIVTIDEIIRKVAEYYKIRFSDMHSPKRSRSVARPRQVAMFLSKQLTTCSLPEIGRKFGGRDHTTVLHGIKKIEELLGANGAVREDIDLLRKTLDA